MSLWERLHYQSDSTLQVCLQSLNARQQYDTNGHSCSGRVSTMGAALVSLGGSVEHVASQTDTGATVRVLTKHVM